MSIKGLDDYVYLDKESHRYFNLDGDEYMSVSKFRSLFKEPFNKGAAYNCAGKGEYENMTPEEVLTYWEVYGKERADEGTRIHSAIELFFDSATILPENEMYRPALLNIASKYKDYYRTYNEVVLYDNESKVAGTADKPLVTTSAKDSVIDITDWKTNIKGVHQVDLDKHGKRINKYMLHCLSHLVNSKYNDYAIQLGIYAYLLQKKTGRKIGQLSIHYINPINPLINYKIPVPYMLNDVKAMFEWKANNYLKIEPAPAPAKKSAFSGFTNSEFLNDISNVHHEEDDSI